MSWVVGQVWPLLVVAALLGAVCTALLMTTRVSVERWVRVEEPEPAPVPRLSVPKLSVPTLSGRTGDATVADGGRTVPDRPASPFPALPGHGPDSRPWEAEELWSRPARMAVGTGRRRSSSDQWSEAAENWRSWADAATGRAFLDTEPATCDAELFAADREVDRQLTAD